jgi:glutamyl-Q tRNA(Asp) synthetase
VAVNAQGEKLSKQTKAPALDASDPLPHLVKALEFLGQNPPRDLAGAELEDFWAWAMANWATHKIPPRRAILSNAY